VAGGGPVTALALEFRAVRETADFGFLAKEFLLRRVDPISAHTDVPRTVRQQAADLASEPLDIVFAYCSCAALGAHVAELSGARLVLIDADVVTPEAIRRDVRRLCESLGAPHSKDPETAFAAVRNDLATLHGGDEQAYEMVDELFGRYRAWLRFLTAAATAEPATPTGGITVIAGKPLPDLGKLLVEPARVELFLVTPESATLESPEVRAHLRDHLTPGWSPAARLA
jgi:hypothetical protein